MNKKNKTTEWNIYLLQWRCALFEMGVLWAFSICSKLPDYWIGTLRLHSGEWKHSCYIYTIYHLHMILITGTALNDYKVCFVVKIDTSDKFKLIKEPRLRRGLVCTPNITSKTTLNFHNPRTIQCPFILKCGRFFL